MKRNVKVPIAGFQRRREKLPILCNKILTCPEDFRWRLGRPPSDSRTDKNAASWTCLSNQTENIIFKEIKNFKLKQ